MPRVSCVVFAAKHIDPQWIRGKSVIDVGACDFNGSIRPLIEQWGCASYLGVDMISGRGVDKVINADNLIDEFGENSFDVVLSLEMMEHSRNWQASLHNMKRICKPDGLLIITAPSKGYMYHGYPTDFWRYQPEDFTKILSDFDVIATEYDDAGPGAFVAARKPTDFQEKDLEYYELFSVVTGTHIFKVKEEHFQCKYFKKTVLKMKIKGGLEQTYRKLGRILTKLLGIK
ncbi:methyltransferase domain-containing protein [Rubellicoccus peritrichatus]|uniref:Methyltransferase domain-containing protein n=1 Tax=Rubellicoccus peritrichatus TaxID=3080537 RepID=A0AAQ3QVF0_9BACT|nr:methyltransferase domain-containing protein [Puniceicoccus sp. CR14]WOO40815.1 methyltransferase domain-containing protein [Puniceicoccus sp. CR14]